ncbi:MAG TPA: molybdopterin-binding protein, partial [Waterburya sp.]
MPRKQQGWITFQSSQEEQKILEQYCQQSQRTKTEILRELVRSLNQPSSPSQPPPTKPRITKDSGASEMEPSQPQPTFKPMRLSARNILRGTVKRVVMGAVNTEVTLEIAPGVELISIITKASAEEMG